MGQINLDCEFGRLLYKYSSDPSIKNICEVGSWNGQGSTKCIMDGILKNNPNAMLYSYEASHEFYSKSVTFWNNIPSQLKLIYGTLHRTIMTKEDVRNHPLFNSSAYEAVRINFDKYYDNDVENMKKCNVVTDVLPEKLDMVVLDAGEWTSFGDWNALKDKSPNIVALDDTNVIKNYYLLRHLVSNGFKVLHSGNDRNGWAILQRV